MNFISRWLQPRIRVSGPRSGKGSLRVGLIADELTTECLVHECHALKLLPSNFARVLRRERPQLVLVESAWSGHRNGWKYGIASYPDHPERHNGQLARMVALARELDIPTVFWNKEDSVHFERFIASAQLFDHVFTIDENCLPRYRELMPRAKTLATLTFAVQPVVHRYTGTAPRQARASFVGSYSRHIHDIRRGLQDMMFAAASRTLGLTVFDRNSDRRAARYRYPELPGLEVKRAVPHYATGDLYRNYIASLNVNTVMDSRTMYSRRLVEIMACGGLAVTTPALSVDTLFPGLCYVVHDETQADELFARLKRDGLSAQDRAMMAAAAEHVAANHTWAQRLAQICDQVGVSA